ncbi:hypothetical protein GGI07_005207 [Coemansia sp. Benny D115]|nr:hypothetical protein GGI07_005207 [Coemansia sp. Benny D115]
MDSAARTETLTRLRELGHSKSYAEIGHLLLSIDDSALYSLVEEDVERGRLNSGNSTAAGLLTATLAMFKGGSSLIETGQAAAGERVLGTIASACVAQICEDDPKDEKDGSRLWTGVCDLLLEVLPQLGIRAVVDTAFRILAELKTCGSTPSALHSFLPMLLDALGAIASVEIVTRGDSLGAQDGDGASITRTGSELKAYWVESACSYRWDPRASVAVCALLREISLDGALVATAAKRMLRQLPLVELTELPAMVYQLLLFARKGVKREVLSGIFGFFDALEDRQELEKDDAEAQKRWCELGDIEGTVMLHFSYSVKQDFELGDALIAHVRELADGAGSGPLSTFSFACLLALAQVHRFEDAVMTLLRTAIVKGIHDSMTLQNTVWMRAYLPPVTLSAKRLLNAVVERAAYGWDQVTQSLVQLSLGTIDYAFSALRRGVYSAPACAEARLVCTSALRRAFAAHEFVRAELLDQILSRVVFQADGFVHFIELLRGIVADDPDFVRPFASKILDVFDSVSVLTPATVEQLLDAAAPLFLEDAPLRASLTLVLRKILFAHSFDDRRTALSGLYVLARSLAAALDECRAEQQRLAGNANGRVARRSDELLSALLEVLGLLRRCLTQQSEVRAMSYEKITQLLDAPSVACNAVVLSVLSDIFSTEFAKYYQPNTSLDSPINIQMCVSPSTHKIVMPVASFLQCFAKLSLARRATEISDGSLAEEGPSDRWVDVCSRFSKAQIEDFELDPTGDYSLSTPSGLRNHNTAVLVIGCLEACFEYAVVYGIRAAGSANAGGDCELNSPALAMELFSKYARFGDILCSRCLDDRKKRVIGSLSDLSSLSLSSVTFILNRLLPDPNRCQLTEISASMSLWAGNHSFIRHLLEVALARVQRRPTFTASLSVASSTGSTGTGTSTLPPAPDTAAVLEIACVVYTRALVHYCSAESPDHLDLPAYLGSKGSLRGRSTLHICCDIFGACVSNLAGSGNLDKLPSLLLPSNPDTAAETLGVCASIVKLVAALCNAVTVLMSQRPASTKESVCVLAAMHQMLGRLAEIATADKPSEVPREGEVDQEAAIEPNVYAAKCLKQTALWAIGLINNDLPGDLGFLKGLLSILIQCQPFLQTVPPPAQPFPGSTEGSLEQRRHPAVSKNYDGREMAPLNQLTINICRSSRVLLGESVPEDEEEPDLDVFTLRTVPSLLAVITSWMRSELHQIDWTIGQLRRCVKAELSLRESHDVDDLEISILVERRICLRITALAHIMMQLLAANLPKVSSDAVIRGFQDMHKTFGQLTRTKVLLPELPVTEAYIDSLSLICTDLNTQAYKTSEKYVIQLGNKLKVQLAHYLKRSTARDFRIETNAIPDYSEIIQNRQALDDREDGGDDAEEEEQRMMMGVEEEEVEVSDDADCSPATEVMGMVDIDAAELSEREASDDNEEYGRDSKRFRNL